MPSNASVLLCVLLGVCAAHSAAALDDGLTTESPKPVVELSTDMLRFDYPSTRLFFGWQRNMNAVLQIGLDGVSDSLDTSRPESWIWRLSLLGAFSAASAIANRAFSITAHDALHIEAALAIGASSAKLVRSDNGRDMSIWEFFLESFNPTLEPGLYLYSKSSPTTDEQAYVAGAGLTANMLIADSIAEGIIRGEGKVMDLAPYLLNKTWGIGYFMETGPTEDGATYITLLNSEGFTVTRDAVISLNVVSAVLSGGMLSLAVGAFDFVAGARSVVRPLSIRMGEASVFWPELTTWLNPRNVSLLVSVNAAWQELLLARLGIEAAVLGDTDVNPEVTVGATVWIARLGLGLDVTTQFDGFPFLKGRAAVRLSDVFTIGIEGFYGERTTMREVREYPAGPGAVVYLTAGL